MRRVFEFIVFATLLGSAGALRAAIVEIKDRAVVDSAGAIRLGDVARVVESDADKRADLEEITIAPAPAAGRTVRLSYEEIRQRLQVKGVNLAEVEIRGRSQIAVTGLTMPAAIAFPPVRNSIQTVGYSVSEPVVTITQQRRVREILDAAFDREFRPAGTSTAPLKFRCECARENVARVLAAPAGQIRFDRPHLVAGGPQPLVAWWINSTGQREQVNLQAWVETTPQGLGVKYAVPKGYVLQPADLNWVTLKDGEAGLNVLGEIVGKETTRALRPGQALQPSDMDDVPLVRTGDIVTVLVRRPGMVVRRQFKANTGGALQDPITLTALDDSRVRVQALVTGYHEATLIGSTADPRNTFEDATGAIQFVPASKAEGAP